MKFVIRKQLGYSGLRKRIFLAKMKDEGNGFKVRVGSDEEDVTNEAALMVAQLVIDEGGTIRWQIGDDIVTLEAKKEKPEASNPQPKHTGE